MAVRVEVLGSGSKGNCTFVHAGRTRVLVDAGFSRPELGRRLAAIGESLDAIDAVLVTHEHGDHLRGAVQVSRQHGVPVACHAETLEAGRIDPARLAEWLPILPDRPFRIGDVAVEPFAVPHDAAMTLGFRLLAEGLVVGYCTDLGHVTPLVRERLSGCHVLIVEANHDLDMLREGPYPWSLKQRVGGRHGHLSNDASADLVGDVVGPDTLAVALAHLSSTNNEPDLALVQARQALAVRGLERVRLVVAGQHAPTAVALA